MTPVILLLVNVSSAVKIAVIPSTVGSSVTFAELLCLPSLGEIQFFTSKKVNCIWNGTKNCRG